MQRKERMAGKAQRGVMEADWFKGFPGFYFLRLAKLRWEASHQQQDVCLLNEAVALKTVETDLMITGRKISFDLL